MDKTVLRQLAELQDMPFAALKERWRSLYGTEPPAYKREHIIRRLAYRIQELAFGGLPDQTKAELERIAEEDECQRKDNRAQRGKSKGTRPLPGTRIVRDWNGQRHEITAVEGGFEYKGRKYKSLSGIAKVITGAHWSGPQFFGLRTTKQIKEAS
ncbi:MAG: DUF2924 domain-containing protein [Planctomycetes bacterium]|nr:DUF2924 domain-containing protein [Planctomycetota bacterium]